MTDQELLEMAAKAAGIRGGFTENHPEDGAPCYSCGINVGKRVQILWNPLADDRDALLLASELCLNIEWFPGQKFVQACRFGIGEIIGWVDEHGRSGSLRRAITVAAAKIGKSMEKSQ